MASLKSILNELLIFRKHLPKGRVDEQYVSEYNAILTAAQGKLEIDLSRFFIKPSDIKQDVVSASYDHWGNPLSVGYGEPYIETNLFLMRVEGAIVNIADKLDIDSPLTD